MPLGFVLGLVALNTVRPTSELAANFLTGAVCMFATVTATYAVLAIIHRAVPPPPHLVLWVIGLALAAALLAVF
jgi:heme/copper-type cytochrome/quinol oxidase subunit 3